MNWVHLHLLINHMPVIGTGCGLLLLVAGRLRKSDELTKAALVVFVLVGLVAVPTYLTGESAEEAMKSIPAVSREMVLAHDDAAAFALGGAIALGVVALGALVRVRRVRWLVWLLLTLAIAVGGLMVYTASLGGQIRHPEIRGTTGIGDSQEKG